MEQNNTLLFQGDLSNFKVTQAKKLINVETGQIWDFGANSTERMGEMALNMTC